MCTPHTGSRTNFRAPFFAGSAASLPAFLSRSPGFTAPRSSQATERRRSCALHQSTKTQSRNRITPEMKPIRPSAKNVSEPCVEAPPAPGSRGIKIAPGDRCANLSLCKGKTRSQTKTCTFNTLRDRREVKIPGKEPRVYVTYLVSMTYEGLRSLACALCSRGNPGADGLKRLALLNLFAASDVLQYT